jgi:hypothetical protein
VTKMRLLSTLAFSASILFMSGAANAEHEYSGYIEDGVDPAARFGVLGVNLAINTVVCGISAAVNDRNVLNDIGVCAAGTAIQYAGMELGVKSAPVLPGIGLRLTETGTSVIYNTLQGNGPFHKLHYGFGPALFEINTGDGKVNLFWRILPAVGFTQMLVEGHVFNFYDSLNYQAFVFRGKKEKLPTGEFRQGLANGNSFFYNADFPQFGAHEFMHVLQYVRMRPFQLLVPEELGFLEDTLHLRVGEDVAFVLATSMQAICTLGGTECVRYWWNPIEAEAYTMQAAYE